MTNEREPLWSDEQYEAYNLGMATEREHQNALSRLSMAKYEARIAELEAQLAQTWQPLPDGEMKLAEGKCWLAGDNLMVEQMTLSSGVVLPDNIRLCRLVESQPAIPPDVRETLRGALRGQRKYINATHPTFDEQRHGKVLAIDTALAWLDQQEATP